MKRPELMDLVGQRVTITSPSDPVTGRLAAYVESPHLILDLDDGQRRILPQNRCKVAPADDTPPKSNAQWERLAIREPNGDVTYTWPNVPPAAAPLGPKVLAMLHEMIANLQQHIDERAQELARPVIADAHAAAFDEVKSAQRAQQYAEDLVTELRRQLTALERNRERYRQDAEEATRQLRAVRATLGYPVTPDPDATALTVATWKRGYQACADHVTTALNGATDEQETDRG